MDFESVSISMVVELSLLFLIGIGPKIALVPYLEATSGMSDKTRQLVLVKMLKTAGVVAVILLALGGLLVRLLHFSTGALAVASGIVLLSLSMAMVMGKHDREAAKAEALDQDPMQLAMFPLAVPYLLNPVGIVVIVTASAESATIGVFAVVFVVLIGMLLLDFVVFRWANSISAHLNPNRMIVTEMVFGFLLAALAVQLILNGLYEVGVINLIH